MLWLFFPLKQGYFFPKIFNWNYLVKVLKHNKKDVFNIGIQLYNLYTVEVTTTLNNTISPQLFTHSGMWLTVNDLFVINGNQLKKTSIDQSGVALIIGHQ